MAVNFDYEEKDRAPAKLELQRDKDVLRELRPSGAIFTRPSMGEAWLELRSAATWLNPSREPSSDPC
jgi:hypothetical protein